MSQRGRPKKDDLAFVSHAAELWLDANYDIGYLARVFAQVALPYRDPGAVEVWGRRNGGLRLVVQPGVTLDSECRPINLGYPYGSIPRLLLVWLSTEAVRTKQRELVLGESLSDFMRQLNLGITGGKTGTITRLREQAQRLFRARITVDYTETVGDVSRAAFEQLAIADGYDLWWSDKRPDQATLMPSYVRLTERFFDEVTQRPVPIDLDALRALRGSPLRLDIYAWLTYRMSYLGKSTIIPWDALMFQFGSAAATKQARRKFRLDFERHLREVLTVYREARVDSDQRGVTLKPSPSHVNRRTPLASQRRKSLATSSQTTQPAVARYCSHGGEAGTLPDGTPRCPSCRRGH